MGMIKGRMGEEWGLWGKIMGVWGWVCGKLGGKLLRMKGGRVVVGGRERDELEVGG